MGRGAGCLGPRRGRHEDVAVLHARMERDAVRPQLGVLRKNMGLIYARKGDAEHARQELQMALKLLPNGPDLIATEQALQQLRQSSPSAH